MIALLPRNLMPFGREALDTFPVLVIQGARQVGKSTFAHLLVSDRPGELFTLDDEQTLAAVRADPRAFVDQFPAATLVIDEVQRAPELILAVKAAVDRHRVAGRFILTGSADLLRMERTPDSLAGRATTLHLLGLSQGEQRHQREDFVAGLRARGHIPSFKTAWDRPAYVSALARGGYPELQGLAGRLRNAWLDSYLERVLQRDARDVFGPTQPARLESLLRLLAANQSGELVKARLADQARIPATTITTYIDVLRALFLIDHLAPWTPNLTKREVGRPKTLVTDPALALRLDRLTEAQLMPLVGSDHLGGLLEGLVVTELTKQAGWSAEEFRLFHFRDRNGLEVDLVIELDDGTIFGIEVKAAKTFKAEHFAGLRGLADRVGSRFLGGIVLNTSDAGYQYADRMWGLPISALWELNAAEHQATGA